MKHCGRLSSSGMAALSQLLPIRAMPGNVRPSGWRTFPSLPESDWVSPLCDTPATLKLQFLTAQLAVRSYGARTTKIALN
jgi:hypothetical protein